MASILESAGVKNKAAEPIKSSQQSQLSPMPSSMPSFINPEKRDIVTQLSGILSNLTFNGSSDMHINLANNATKEIEYRAQKPYNPSLMFMANSNSKGSDIFNQMRLRTYDDKLQAYAEKYYANTPKEALTSENLSDTRKQMVDYISSPLYEKRQSNYPEQYQGKLPEENPKTFQESTAKLKREKRLNSINNIPVEIIKSSGDIVGEFEPNQGGLGKISISSNMPPNVAAHEMAHVNTYYDMPLTKEQLEIKAKNNGVLPDDEKIYYERLPSDEVNSVRYYKNSRGENTDLSDVDPNLNKAEEEKFIKLARAAHPSTIGKTDKNGKDYTIVNPGAVWVRDDPHYSKDVENKTQFVNEQYGDLYSIRKLLLDNGITNSFGEDLDKDKMKKALKNENITKDPTFKRFYNRYSEKDIIELNNTIATNTPIKTSQVYRA